MHHRWVVAKFGLTVTVMILPIFVYQPVLDRGYALVLDGHTAHEINSELGFLGLLSASGLSPLLLLTAAVLSMYKPGKRTLYGRRRTGGRAPGVNPGPATIPVVVSDTRPVADDVVSLRLRSVAGGCLPEWSPGAHIDLKLPSGLTRQYSLHGSPDDCESYQVAVRKEPGGRGGSIEAHRLVPGDVVAITGPHSHFPFVPAPGYLFRRAMKTDADRRLLYIGRTANRMAFVNDLRTLDAAHVTVVTLDTQERPDLATELRNLPDSWVVYCCGPTELIAAVEAPMSRKRATHRLYVEHFVATLRDDGPSRPFQVKLGRTGRLLNVPANRSLLNVIREVLPQAESSCENGLCGRCELRVLDGVPEHRDNVLNPDEQNRTDVIYPCVSRSRTTHLIVDR